MLWSVACDNFLYVSRARAARRAPGWPPPRAAPRKDDADRAWRSPRRSPGRFRGRLRVWAPPAALRPSGPRRHRRTSSSPRPAAPAGRHNDQRQARELQERAILPAPIVKPGKIARKGATRHT